MQAMEAQNLDAYGVPTFAKPWIELGKLEERERWQILSINLIELAIASELQDLKKGVAEVVARLPDLRQNIIGRVDASQAKISVLIGNYKKQLGGEKVLNVEKSEAPKEEAPKVETGVLKKLPSLDLRPSDTVRSSELEKRPSLELRPSSTLRISREEKKVSINALQHQQFVSCEGSMPDATDHVTDCIEEESG